LFVPAYQGENMQASLFVIALAALAGGGRTVLEVGALPEVEIDSLWGEVEVRAGGSGAVEVVARAEGDGHGAQVRRTARGARIAAGCLAPQGAPKGGASGAPITLARSAGDFVVCRAGSVRLSVLVPPDADVLVHAVRGDVHVRGVSGALSIDVIEGDVFVEGAVRPVAASSRSGAVQIASAPAVQLSALARAARKLLVRALAGLPLLLRWAR
jgi:hypothetical protein